MSPTSRGVITAVIAFPLSLVLGHYALVAQAPAAKPPVQRMHEHFATVGALENAVIRADLDDVKASAKSLADQLSMDGLPPDGQKHLSDLKAAAIEASKAADMQAAATATGKITATCGTCHATLGRAAKVDVPTAPAADPSLKGRMREHIWAVDVMSLGLQSPSDELWTKGADALAKAPVMKSTGHDAAVTADLNAAEATFRDLAKKAQGAKDPYSRGAVYGEILGNCGSCHSLHGSIFGPGLPK